MINCTSDIKLINIKEWDSLIINQTEGNIFQSPMYYEAVNKTNSHECIGAFALEDNRLKGVLIATIQKESNGILGVFSARAIVIGGPIIEDTRIEILSQLLAFFTLIIKKKAIYSQFRNLYPTDQHKEIFKSFGYKFEEHLNIIINLEKNEDELWKSLHAKRRNEIKRAKRELVTVEINNDEQSLKNSFSILNEVYSRAKLPLVDHKIFFKLVEHSNVDFKLLNFTAKYKNEIIGCMLILAYKNILYDYYAGSYQKFYNKYPNDIIPWEIFMWGKKNGYKLFDFGGAGKPDIPYGVRDYKMKFGGDLVNFGRYEMVHKPFLFLLGKLGLKVYKFLK
jgi:serine/alanine adding enzyme